MNRPYKIGENRIPEPHKQINQNKIQAAHPRTAQANKLKQKIDGASPELHSLLAWIYGQKALPFPPHNIPDAHIRTSGSLFSGRSEATGFLRTESLNVLFLRTFFAQAKKVRPRSAIRKSLLKTSLFAQISSTPIGRQEF